VVVAGLLEKEGKILLVQENLKEADKGKWNYPAGWLDLDESPIEGVRREVKEETGYDFVPSGLVGIFSTLKYTHRREDGSFPHPVKLVFAGKFFGQAIKASEEIAQIKWFLPEEIYKMDKTAIRDEDIKQAVKDYFEGKLYPLGMIHHRIVQ
jgi:8-oxo-dGTP pyrophosphatase MutT (NUDIX family)